MAACYSAHARIPEAAGGARGLIDLTSSWSSGGLRKGNVHRSGTPVTDDVAWALRSVARALRGIAASTNLAEVSQDDDRAR